MGTLAVLEMFKGIAIELVGKTIVSVGVVVTDTAVVDVFVLTPVPDGGREIGKLDVDDGPVVLVLTVTSDVDIETGMLIVDDGGRVVGPVAEIVVWSVPLEVVAERVVGVVSTDELV